MADFTSQFWHWFVVVLTIGSIVGLLPLIWMNRGQQPGAQVETMGHVWDDDLEEYNNPLPAWWLNLFVITIVFSLVYLLLYPGLGNFQGFLGWSSKAQYEQEVAAIESELAPLYADYAAIPIPELVDNRAAMRTGRRLFLNYCAQCHGSDARGSLGFPNLTDDDWIFGGEPNQIYTSILDGRSGIMPGLESMLQAQGVEAVTHFVLSLSELEHDAQLAAAGQDQYQKLCFACHQADGSGNTALGAPNLTDDVWLYGSSYGEVRHSIAVGRNGEMPAHKQFLGEEKVHLLAAYVYSLSAEN